MVNIYNKHPFQEIFYQVWVNPNGGGWVLKHGMERLKFKPALTELPDGAKVVEVEQISKVVEVVEAS